MYSLRKDGVYIISSWLVKSLIKQVVDKLDHLHTAHSVSELVKSGVPWQPYKYIYIYSLDNLSVGICDIPLNHVDHLRDPSSLFKLLDLQCSKAKEQNF